MNKSHTVAIMSLIIALMAGITTSTMVLQAFADPKVGRGTCFNENNHGATGCAGNQGGYVQTPNGRCIEQKTPFSEFHGACD